MRPESTKKIPTINVTSSSAETSPANKDSTVTQPIPIPKPVTKPSTNFYVGSPASEPWFYKQNSGFVFFSPPPSPQLARNVERPALLSSRKMK